MENDRKIINNQNIKKMKNTYLALFIALITIFSAQAQLTGGGKKDKVNTKGKTEKGVFDNSFYWTFSSSSATGDFALDIDDIDDFDKGRGGMGGGFGTSIGSIIYLNNIDFHEQIKVGIDVTYLNWVMLFAADVETPADGSTHFFSMKVGPLVSYNPIDNVLIDLRLTLQPSTIIYINTIEDGYDEYGQNYKYIMGAGSKIRTGLGLNVRYRPFTIGFELSSGKVSLKDMDYGDKYTKRKTGRFDFKVGFSF